MGLFSSSEKDFITSGRFSFSLETHLCLLSHAGMLVVLYSVLRRRKESFDSFVIELHRETPLKIILLDLFILTGFYLFLQTKFLSGAFQSLVVLICLVLSRMNLTFVCFFCSGRNHSSL